MSPLFKNCWNIFWVHERNDLDVINGPALFFRASIGPIFEHSIRCFLWPHADILSRIPSHFQPMSLPLEETKEERMKLHNPSYCLLHQEEHHRRVDSLTAVWWEQEDPEAGVGT